MNASKYRLILRLGLVLIPLMIVVVPGLGNRQNMQAVGDPLGSFQSPGPSAPLNWTGDGQRIGNPSFEAGNLNSWILLQNNAATGSIAQLSSLAFDGTSSALLTVNSANATSDSSLSLMSDLTTQQVGFNAAVRLRAALYVTGLTGTSSSDRIEVSITLALSSSGDLRVIHYFFGGGSLPTNSTTDAYFSITGPVSQWISIDRNVAADALARFPANFTSIVSVRDVKISVYSRTTGIDPKIRYYDANSNFAWDVGEPVVYDGNSDRYFQMLNDQILDGPPPGSALKTDPKIKFIDANFNGVRDPTETVVYDSNNNGVYDFPEPIIIGQTPGGSPSLSSDPKIKYNDPNNSSTWNPTEPVIYDSNSNDLYDIGETIIDGPTQSSILQDDPRIKFVDNNNNKVFNVGESIIFDANNNGVYDSGEPVIAGSAPNVGTKFSQLSRSNFDRVELYSATGNFEWVRNNGFETGTLAGWGAYGGGFQATSLRALSGTYSANATVSGSAIDMAQSLDSQPKIEAWSRFKASAYVSQMTGASAQDVVDIWLGLVDNSSVASPAFVHYIIKTGDGTIPANTTSSIYHRVSSFGIPNRWLNISSTVQGETAYFSTLLYTPPFHLLVVGVQVSAQGAFRTTAFFDEFSYFGPYHPGPFTSGLAASYRYAVDGRNSTYVYTVANIPHGAFYLLVPRGMSVLNITAPGGVAILRSEYSTNLSAGTLRIDVPVSTSFRYAPQGDWQVYMTSTNAAATVYTEDPATRSPNANLDPGTVANLVSQSKDPFGNPVAGADATLSIWTSTATNVGPPQTGTTSVQGWFNVSSITLPSTNGAYKLQATVNSTYIGVLAFQFFLGPQPIVADFVFSPASPKADAPVTFTATATGGKTPYTFSWNFGDLATGTGSSTTHTYTTKGSYNVAVTVIDNAGTSVTVTHTLAVHYELTVSLNPPTGQVSAGSSVTITGQVNPAKQSVNVTISYHRAGEAWTVLGTALTDSNGRFSYTWTPLEGDYELKASVLDPPFTAVSSNEQLIVSPGPSQIPWLIIAGIAAAAIVLFALFFITRRRVNPRSSEGKPV